MTGTSPDSGSPPTAVESLIGSNRAALGLLLVAVPAVSWAWIVAMARDMYGPMSGASRWMMTAQWDARHLVLLWAMWAVMMTGMMLPSATPALLLYGAAARRRYGAQAAGSIYAMAAGYLGVWALFSVVATVAQRALSSALVLSPMMELSNPRVGAGLLFVAGAYQLTPLKQACLRACQSPLGFLMARWSDGKWGAMRMGISHGIYCLGCCWALMLLLFVGGVMNLAVIAGLTLFVGFEKMGLFGRHGSRVSGLLLMALAGWLLIG